MTPFTRVIAWTASAPGPLPACVSMHVSLFVRMVTGTHARATHHAMSPKLLQLPPSSVSSLIVHMVTAGIVWKAASLLPRPGSPAARHEAELMQSLRAMAVVFLQIGTMQWFSSAVTMMEAAITWPQLVVVFSAFVALTCLVRYGGTLSSIRAPALVGSKLHWACGSCGAECRRCPPAHSGCADSGCALTSGPHQLHSGWPHGCSDCTAISNLRTHA